MNQETINLEEKCAINLFWPVPRGQSLYFLKNKIANRQIIMGEQTHSNKVAIVKKKSPEIIDGVDGLVTIDSDVVLAVAVADCQIIFAFDSNNRVAGIAHAGREGTYNNIAGELIKKMTKLGAKTGDIKIYISPSIDECHYEIDATGDTNFYKQFLLKFGNRVAKKKPSGKFLNLREAQIQNLINSGILLENIDIDNRCTYHAPEMFPSHRREGNRRIGNLIGIIELI